MKTSLAFLTLSVILFLSAALTDHKPAPETGLPVTGKKDVDETFEKAVLLLHNFEYDDAAELFVEAQQKDPAFAMAYWGEAMTYDHPVWGDLDIEKARAALARLGNTPEARQKKTKSELEKDLIRSIEILFGEGSKPDREKKYSDFMGTLQKKYPENIEVSALYALSLLGTKKAWTEWEENNEQAARIARKILASHPDHPGALHYLVHANDHPAHARDGLDAANKYAIAASYAGHALHMPSHIYLALGMWDDVVRSNEVSWKASIDHKEKKNLDNDDYSYHSFLWLQYGYLQQGRFAKGNDVLNKHIGFTKELPSVHARFHIVQMRGHYLYETNDWSSPLADLPIKTDDIWINSQFNNHLVEAYKPFVKKDVASLQEVTDQMERKLADEIQFKKANENITICGVARFVKTVPSEQDIRFSTAQLNKVRGLLAWSKNDLAKAEEHFKAALPKEGSVVIGPPLNIIPAHELYGKFLLANRREREAYDHFSKALLASPNRVMALKGQLAAAKAMRDSSKENDARNQLSKILSSADEAAKRDL